jgi:hypothetical protein
MSAFSDEAKIRQLEFRLYRHLGVPVSQLETADVEPRPAQGAAEANLEQVRLAVRELRQRAASIGAIPAGYPRHIHLVMKVISALLPWYTRSLVQFGHQAVETAETLAEAITALARRRELLSSGIDHSPADPRLPGRPSSLRAGASQRP